MSLDNTISSDSKKFLKELRWFDILILTIILFGGAIYSSTVMYISLVQGASPDLNTLFNMPSYYYGQFIKLFSFLIMAFVYLWFRNFDFSMFKIKISLKSTIFGILLFVVTSLMLDFAEILVQQFYGLNMDGLLTTMKLSTQDLSRFVISRLSFPIILHSLLNGFYEEIFFMGMCLLVNSKYRTVSFVISLFIRFSFHTYQGILPAVLIGFLYGGIYYFVYKKMKNKNLYPFFISHTLGDIFGTSILYYFSGSF